MTTLTSFPTKEIKGTSTLKPAKIRPIGGVMGEVDDFESTERPTRSYGMPSVGSIYFRTVPVEIGQKALDLSGATTKTGYKIVKGIGEGFFDVLKMIKGEQNKPKTPETMAKDQKEQESQAQTRFVTQRTSQTEQLISNQAKKRMQEAVIGLAGESYSTAQAKEQGFTESFRLNTASGIARARREKIKAQIKRKNAIMPTSRTGSGSKDKMRGLVSGGGKANMLTTAEDQNMSHAG